MYLYLQCPEPCRQVAEVGRDLLDVGAVQVDQLKVRRPGQVRETKLGRSNTWLDQMNRSRWICSRLGVPLRLGKLNEVG